jgi:cysteine desulfurase/selenocysteine lyase
MNYKNDFPIFKHNANLVYLDSAATSQKPQLVIDTISDFYSTYNANIHRGIYPIAEKATAKVEEVRRKIASFINASDPSEIIFTKGATEGINLVMQTWGNEHIKQGDMVITSVLEHHANFVPWQMLTAKNDALFRVIDISDNGYIDEVHLLEDATSAKLLAISSVSNMLGTIIDVEKLIRIVRKKNNKIKILVDVAQDIPHRKIDVKKMDCDFLVFSGHKMLAGTGIGVLFIKKDIARDMSPFLLGGDMIKEVTLDKTTFASPPTRFEAGTLGIAEILSLGAAIDYLENFGFATMLKHEKELMEYAYRELEKIQGLTIYGPSNLYDRGSVIAFNIDSIHPHDIAQVLAEKNICVRSGHHCTMPLHTRLGIPASVRASFYLYNTTEDVAILIAGIHEAIKLFKK